MDDARAGMPARGGSRRVRRALAAALILLGGFTALARAGGDRPSDVRAPQYWPPLEHPPLDPPLRLSATFGEYRIGHFHAGLDLSTGETIGHPVYASLSGYVVRVRASGVGYGRSIYLQAPDGRLLVYGHLDAFDEPLASYVDSVQRATGQYEQDLWPAVERFHCVAGQRLGWSGRSGTDAPHLHFEIRRGDVAYNPLLAGVSVEDTVAPVIRSVTMYPLGDPRDVVDGRTAAVTKRVRAGRDTFALSDHAGLLVESADARADGRLTMAPWCVRATLDGKSFECRFDSVSWADGMSEVDYVYDRGLRAPGAPRSLLMGAMVDLRSHVERWLGDEEWRLGFDREEPTGTIVEGPKELHLETEDAAGNGAEAIVLLTPMEIPDEVGSPSDSLTVSDGRRARGGALQVWLGEGPDHRLGEFTWHWKEENRFVGATIECALSGRAPRAGELVCHSDVLSLHPVLQPIRTPFPLSVRVTGKPDRRLGLYRDTGEGWEWIGADYDAKTGRIGAETRRLGRFALFRDLLAPRITLHAPPRTSPATPYPTWALEATLAEQGSGVEARATYFLVDGRRVPSEWDAVANTLRWRPLRPPLRGTHEVVVVAADRAGNTRRHHGSFVLD